MIEQCIIEIGPCDSVMSAIKEQLRHHKANEGAMWITPYQLAGRGQAGNTWRSQPGLNLLSGMILYPQFLEPAEQFLISKVVALAVTDVLGQYAKGFCIKWPNDIYWNEHKIGGILIEGVLQGEKLKQMVVGLGVNIHQTEFDRSIPNPVSLTQITGVGYDIKQLAEAIHETILFWYAELKGDKNKINTIYASRLLGFKTQRTFKDASGLFSGVISGVESSGRLCVVDSQNNTRHYWFKEVEHIFD